MHVMFFVEGDCTSTHVWEPSKHLSEFQLTMHPTRGVEASDLSLP